MKVHIPTIFESFIQIKPALALTNDMSASCLEFLNVFFSVLFFIFLILYICRSVLR